MSEIGILVVACMRDERGLDHLGLQACFPSGDLLKPSPLTPEMIVDLPLQVDLSADRINTLLCAFQGVPILKSAPPGTSNGELLARIVIGMIQHGTRLADFGLEPHLAATTSHERIIREQDFDRSYRARLAAGLAPNT